MKADVVRRPDAADHLTAWPDYTHFGRVMRDRRRELRLSQESLAAKADINRSFVGEVERGAAIPTLSTLGKLAAALEIRLSALLARCEADGSVPAAPTN